jgi:hypothetical protein
MWSCYSESNRLYRNHICKPNFRVKTIVITVFKENILRRLVLFLYACRLSRYYLVISSTVKSQKYGCILSLILPNYSGSGYKWCDICMNYGAALINLIGGRQELNKIMVGQLSSGFPEKGYRTRSNLLYNHPPILPPPCKFSTIKQGVFH